MMKLETARHDFRFYVLLACIGGALMLLELSRQPMVLIVCDLNAVCYEYAQTHPKHMLGVFSTQKATNQAVPWMLGRGRFAQLQLVL